MNKKVKIGILGCADVADRYAINAFKAINNAEVVCIASRNPRKAQKWALRFDIQAGVSYDTLLADKNIDAIYIPLPVGLHKKWAIKAALSGKHVICEKSLADNFVSACQIIETFRRNNLVLYENIMCDFHPQHTKVQTLLRDGDIGKPFVFRSFFGFPPFKKNNIRYDKKLGGSSLYDAGSYAVFMARKLFREEPLSVYCHLVHDDKYGVDIEGAATLEFPKNQVAQIGFSYRSVYQNNYSLVGSKGLINVEMAYSIPPTMRPKIELVKNDRKRNSTITIDAPPANQFELIFHDFCDTILHYKRKKKKVHHIFRQMIAQAKVLEALRLSSQDKRRVDVGKINFDIIQKS